MQSISRRSLLSAGAAVGLTAALGIRPVRAQDSALYEAAKGEGELNLYWGSYEQKTIDELIVAFKARYPGINVNLLRQASQTVYTRLRLEMDNDAVQCDSLGTTNVLHYNELKSLDALRPYKPAEVGMIPEAFRTLDPDGLFYVGAISLSCINRSSAVEGPKSWAEMVGGDYAGEISCGSPAHSGDVAHWTVAMLAKFGDDFLRDFAAQKPKIGQSSVDAVTDILAGERTLGAAAPYSYTLTQKAAGNPIDVTMPSDDAILNLGITGIPGKAPHPNAGQLFNEFLYSPEASQVLVANNWPSLRTDVPWAGGMTLDQIAWYRNPADGLAEAMAEAIEKWKAIVA
ncbi:MAG: extracellular solute-binding protein [Rhodobacteraceae bacterium]|jgi:iron(III) transport system substrate-binding protein|nr:extracellular solute-binding protein [Paracoccaceae bacterium]